MNIHNQFKIRAVIFIFSFTFSAFSYAEMYKWVDEEGNTHYTQSPPPGDINAESIKPPPKIDTESASKDLEKKQERVEKLREQRITSAEEQEKAAQEEAEKEEECRKAKARLASYQRPRVNVQNPDGSLRVLPENERQAEIKKSEEYVKKACN